MHAATWWIDRWRKSTAYTDMTLAEQGAYRNLLDELWLRDGVLPDDDRILGRISGDPVEWPRLREKVLARFRLTSAGWVNETQAEVYSASRARMEALSERGRNAAAVRWSSTPPGKPPGIGMHEHMPEDMLGQYPPVSGLQKKKESDAFSIPGGSGRVMDANNEISLDAIKEVSLAVLEIWNNAAAWVRENHPKGRRWATHRTLPQKSTGPIRQHLERLGREEFLAQLRAFLRWAVRDEFWTSLRHDGHQSDNWIPTVISALDVEKWDVRLDVAEASHENHRTLDQESADEDAREAAANEELQRILAIEREKIDRADRAAGGSVNLLFADDTPINDPELISVVDAAEELIRRNRNGAAS